MRQGEALGLSAGLDRGLDTMTCKTVHLYVTASLIKLRYFKENLTDRHRDCALKYSKCSSSSSSPT